MTEKELTHRAKVFRQNSEANGEEISFADSCKVVLLAAFIDKTHAGNVSYEPDADMFIVREDLMKVYQELSKSMVRDLLPRWIRWMY